MRQNRARERRTRRPDYLPIGTPLGIQDKNGADISVGDYVVLYNDDGTMWAAGRVFCHRLDKEAYVYETRSIWYPPFDELDRESYGKEKCLPLNNSFKPFTERIAGPDVRGLSWNYETGLLEINPYWTDAGFQIRHNMNALIAWDGYARPAANAPWPMPES